MSCLTAYRVDLGSSRRAASVFMGGRAKAEPRLSFFQLAMVNLLFVKPLRAHLRWLFFGAVCGNLAVLLVHGNRVAVLFYKRYAQPPARKDTVKNLCYVYRVKHCHNHHLSYVSVCACVCPDCLPCGFSHTAALPSPSPCAILWVQAPARAEYI